MLTSIHNPRVRAVRALLDRRRAREEERRFVAEGVRLIEAALDAGVRPAAAFYAAELVQSERGRALVARLRALTETVEVSAGVMDEMSDTETPQGVVAVLPFLDSASLRRNADGNAPLVLVVDGVRDPGNLGTLLRSAAAVGVSEVLLAPDTVDLYNPKAVRAGMGAHFVVPAEALPWAELTARLAGLVVRVAAAEARQAYDAVDWTVGSALIIGGEAEGASAEARRIAQEHVVIPMRSGVESLNAAMAATVILFEAQRQRRVSQR
ncbi:MAG: RNA methyltransferase [Anaerolineae bacterium]